MTVGELKKALESFEDDLIVYVDRVLEGGAEDEATEVAVFHPDWLPRRVVKIK